MHLLHAKYNERLCVSSCMKHMTFLFCEVNAKTQGEWIWIVSFQFPLCKRAKGVGNKMVDLNRLLDGCIYIYTL